VGVGDETMVATQTKGRKLKKCREKFWWGNLRERDHLGDPDLDGWIMLSSPPWIIIFPVFIIRVRFQCTSMVVMRLANYDIECTVTPNPIQEVECGCMDWIELAQDRDRLWTLVNAVMNLRVT